MDKKLKEELDGAIKEAVEELKKEDPEKVEKKEDEKVEEKSDVEKKVEAAVAFAPPTIIRKAEGPEFSYCRLIKAMASGDWRNASFEKAAIEKTYPTPELSNLSAGAGGYLIPPEYSMELIDLMTAQAVVRQAGASIYPMNSDTLYIPTMSAGATVYWGAEAGDKSIDTSTAFGQVELTAKKLYCLVGISNELLADSSPAVETIIRKDIIRQLALVEDQTFLQGYDSASAPTGLVDFDGDAGDPLIVDGSSSLLGSGQLLFAGLNDSLSSTTSGATGGVPVYDDILNLLYTIEANNTKATGFIMHPRTKNALRKIQDANGQYIYAIHPEQKIPDALYGLPVFLTTQIGITTDTIADDGASNLSYIIAGDWSDFIIGQRQSVELAVSEHVGFQTDSTWIRATLRVDSDVKHAESFAVLSECQS